jgi:Tfp pilus assembly protein PilZ
MSEQKVRQRRHPRVPVAIPVRISSIDPETDGTGCTIFRSSEERLANLSRGGACIRSAEPLAPGRRVLLELELPDGDLFETVGRVAWSRLVVAAEGGVEAGCGIEFLEATGDRSARLEHLIAQAVS